MSTDDDPILAALRKLAGKVDGKPTALWGFVASTSPLMVFLDGAIDKAGNPVARPAQSAVGMVGVGQRVLCADQSNRVMIIGGGKTGGTTAERDAHHGVPATDAARAALANQRPSWDNTTTGRREQYYAPAGTPGLAVRGLIAGTPAGWYPAAGELVTCTRIQQNGFQLIAAGVVTPATLMAPMVNIGGFTALDNGIRVPHAGIYTVSAAVYFSGGGTMPYTTCMVHESYAGGWRELISSRVPGNAADVQHGVTATGVHLPAMTMVTLSAQSGGAQNIYGDGINRRTFLALRYDGPPLENS